MNSDTPLLRGIRPETSGCSSTNRASLPARRHKRVFENRQVRPSRLLMVVIMATWNMASWWSVLGFVTRARSGGAC